VPFPDVVKKLIVAGTLPTEIKYFQQDIVCEWAARCRIIVPWPTESVLSVVDMGILEVIPCTFACAREFSSRPGRMLLQELQ
jgi:hypothetical protein